MSNSLYYQQSLLAADADFLARCLAAASKQQTVVPDSWAYVHAQQLAATPGFAEAYASALVSEVENPGRDGAVITDGQLLSATATILNPANPDA